jgi:hypothetical protein
VRDDDRQSIFVFRADVDKMNVQPINFGDELRQVVQLRLARAPIILRPPIAGEFRIVASCTPCDAFVTGSRSGHFVAAMRSQIRKLRFRGIDEKVRNASASSANPHGSIVGRDVLYPLPNG